MSDVFIGKETAKIAAQVLSGTPIESIPCLVVPADIVSVNSDTLKALGLTLPESLSELGEVQYLTSK
jgi:putative ABC transport system substrate-binding protein